MERGLFIAFEGIDGSGLTTQAEKAQQKIENGANPKLLQQSLDENESHERTTYLTKEPTDGPAGGPLRLALDERLELDPESFALLFATDRKDHTEQIIKPMLNDGKIVLADRYYLSSLAYQWSDGVDFEWVKSINSKCITPDLTILLDVKASEAKRRIEKGRLNTQLYENEERLARSFTASEQYDATQIELEEETAVAVLRQIADDAFTAATSDW